MREPIAAIYLVARHPTTKRAAQRRVMDVVGLENQSWMKMVNQ
jgi:hypothetical protein